MQTYAVALANKRRRITLERVDAVTQDGRCVVRGRALPVTGRVPVTPGETVAVAWEDGQPVVVMLNEGRRGGAPPALGEETLVIVEELFLPDTGEDRRLWFRNGTDFRPVLFDDRRGTPLATIGGSLVDVSSVFWGRASRDHFAITGFLDSNGHRVVAVYDIRRPRPEEPFAPGANVRPRLVRLYDLDDPAGPSFGTLSVSNGAGTASSPLRAFSGASVAGQVISPGPNGNFATQNTTSATCAARYEAVAPNGDLLLRLTVQGSTNIDGPDPGQSTLAAYQVGTLLVNRTRGTVLVAAAPDLSVPLFVKVVDNPPVPPVFVCNAITGNAVTSTGHHLDSGPRGDVTLLSLKMAGQVPTVNNYAVVEHADLDASGTQGAAACYPNGGSDYSPATFRVVGEFAQVVATLPGGTIATAQRPTFQASRTHVLWAKLVSGDYHAPRALFLTDLRGAETAQIGAEPELVLLVPAATELIPQFPQRQMVAVRSGLLYAPQGESPTLPPQNVQFFVAGGTSGANAISQAGLKKDPALQPVASLRRVKTAAEALIVGAEDADLQSLNSESLGARRSSSAL